MVCNMIVNKTGCDGCVTLYALELMTLGYVYGDCGAETIADDGGDTIEGEL